MTTSLTTVPSLAIFQEDGESALKINFYYGSIEIQQGNDSIIINDSSIKEVIKALRNGRKEADIHLNRK